VENQKQAPVSVNAQVLTGAVVTGMFMLSVHRRLNQIIRNQGVIGAALDDINHNTGMTKDIILFAARVATTQKEN
jgi:hypothetical protein